jgi:Flp pilus assembly secretin CpaC
MFRVAIDQARPLNLSAPAAGVVVGNPSIAGVSLQSDRLLFITGRSYGITNLIVVGANGRPIYESRISVVPDENGSTVMVTRGTSTVRHDCAPVCRRTPDIADDTNAFDEVSKQVATHSGAANAQ